MSLWLGILGASGLISGGEYDAIATATVSSGGTSYVEFSSIPQGYSHLHIRGVSRDQRPLVATSGTSITFNVGEGESLKYAYHWISANGAGPTIGASSTINYPRAWSILSTGGNGPTGVFSPFIVDVFNYSSSTTNTTVRSFVGAASGTAQSFIYLLSGIYLDTSPVSLIRISDGTGNGLAQHSTYALYGVK